MSTLIESRFEAFRAAHELKPWFRGDYLVLVLDGTELRLSRRFRANRFVSDW